MRKVPTNASPLTFWHVLQGGVASLATECSLENFEKAFASWVGQRHCLAVNKGTTALYLAIMAMHRLTGKTEVLLPAYTVPTLTLAINKAGLKTRLSDISLDTFNMDADAAAQAIMVETLCVVPVHMFGFPCELTKIRELCTAAGAYMLEDPAQAMGAELAGRKVGSFGDVSLFSLCKGKVISTFQGGMAVTDNDELAALMLAERKRLPLARDGVLSPALLIALAMAMKPMVYGGLYPLIKRFKSTEVHEHFEPAQFSGFKAAVATKLLKDLDETVACRFRLGMAMYNGLQGIDWLRLPKIIPGARPVFNHLPVLIDDPKRLERIAAALWSCGIDTARFYQRPIHHIYDLGYGRSPDPFPNATYLAPRLLALPSHPYMKMTDVEKIVEVFRQC